ncbi:MAG: hypothetical protein HFJ26_01840 [Clostridia bacterium]|nr:hypothetical protein [Clostridia bacterium]
MNQKKQVIICGVIAILVVITGIIVSVITRVKQTSQIEILNCKIDINGITVSIKENTLTKDGCIVVFTSEDEFVYTDSSGDFYTLYGLENSKWIRLPIKVGKWNATELETSRPPTKLLEESLDWSNKYGELNKGRYIIEREISINGISGKFSIEFKIE